MPPSKLKSLHGNRSYGIKRSNFRKSSKFSPKILFFSAFLLSKISELLLTELRISIIQNDLPYKVIK